VGCGSRQVRERMWLWQRMFFAIGKRSGSLPGWLAFAEHGRMGNVVQRCRWPIDGRQGN